MKKYLLGISIGLIIGLSIGVKHEGNKDHEIISPIPKSTPSPTSSPTPTRVSWYEEVSWYGQEYCEKFNPACIMANGEPFDENALTCACSDRYQLGDYLRVSFKGKSVVVRCTDRGSFKDKYGRSLDLAKKAFLVLAGTEKGLLRVQIERIK